MTIITSRTQRPRDLAPIAALGAVADGFFVDGRLVSQNHEAALDAVRQGKMEIREHESGEQYLLKGVKGGTLCIDEGDYLDVLGGVGYYQGGPEMGIKVALEGRSPESDKMVEELKAIRTRVFDEEIKRNKAGEMKQTPHIQWFHVGGRFFPMGVKMIGAFCDAIKDTDLIDPRRYLAGFQVIPDQIPGFGAIAFNEVKISMRVSPYMEGEIRAGRAPDGPWRRRRRRRVHQRRDRRVGRRAAAALQPVLQEAHHRLRGRAYPIQKYWDRLYQVLEEAPLP